MFTGVYWDLRVISKDPECLQEVLGALNIFRCFLELEANVLRAPEC